MKVTLRSLLAVAALAMLAGGPVAAKDYAAQRTTHVAAPEDYDLGYADGIRVVQFGDPQLVADEIQKANYLLERATTIREYDFLSGYLNGLQTY